MSRIRIYYVASVASQLDGVVKKVLAQFSFLKNLCHETKLILTMRRYPDSSMKQALSGFDDVIVEVVGNAGVSMLEARRKKILSMRVLLEKTDKDTVVYFRYPISDKYFLQLVDFLSSDRRCKIVTEHQSLESIELRESRKLLSLISEILYGKRVRNRTSAFVGVTREICDYEIKRSGSLKKPCIVIGNGVDASSFPLRTPPVFDGEDLKLLAVAQVARWHGLDRLIRGLAEYRGSPRIWLSIVGDGSEIPALRKLVSRLGLEDLVSFHGFKTGKELDEFFDKCHIAVGSLAIHRAGSGSPLKSKEYCARGIPFIDSVDDGDFCKSFPLRLKIRSSEEPVDIAMLVEFAKKAFNVPEHPKRMREYAMRRLDWSVKMRRLVEFFGQIMSEKRKGR